MRRDEFFLTAERNKRSGQGQAVITKIVAMSSKQSCLSFSYSYPELQHSIFKALALSRFPGVRQFSGMRCRLHKGYVPLT